MLIFDFLSIFNFNVLLINKALEKLLEIHQIYSELSGNVLVSIRRLNSIL